MPVNRRCRASSKSMRPLRQRKIMAGWDHNEAMMEQSVMAFLVQKMRIKNGV